MKKHLKKQHNSKNNYFIPTTNLLRDLTALLLGTTFGYMVFQVFFRIVGLSVFFGIAFGIIYVYVNRGRAMATRLKKLRVQFYDMLTYVAMSMKVTHVFPNALKDTYQRLRQQYGEKSDIAREVKALLDAEEYGNKIADALDDFATRCNLEDVNSFAKIYKTSEDTTTETDMIVERIASIISEKSEIEMEIETLLSGVKYTFISMSIMVLIILTMIGNMGFTSAIYEENGRIVAIIGIIMYFVAIFLGNKISDVKV